MSTNSHMQFGWFCPAVKVTRIPTIQTRNVLDTSPIDLASALMYLVTVTPVMLNVAIENTPIITNKKSVPFEATYEKYCSGRSKNDIPVSFNTHDDSPKLHGANVRIGSKTNSMHKPNAPSQPTTIKGSRWYFDRSFCSKTNKNPFVNNDSTTSRYPTI